MFLSYVFNNITICIKKNCMNEWIFLMFVCIFITTIYRIVDYIRDVMKKSMMSRAWNGVHEKIVI